MIEPTSKSLKSTFQKLDDKSFFFDPSDFLTPRGQSELIENCEARELLNRAYSIGYADGLGDR